MWEHRRRWRRSGRQARLRRGRSNGSFAFQYSFQPSSSDGQTVTHSSDSANSERNAKDGRWNKFHIFCVISVIICWAQEEMHYWEVKVRQKAFWGGFLGQCSSWGTGRSSVESLRGRKGEVRLDWWPSCCHARRQCKSPVWPPLRHEWRQVHTSHWRAHSHSTRRRIDCFQARSNIF